MLSIFFTIARRNFIRHKIYTAINVLGLALGVSACIVIFLETRHDFSFDRFHPEKERIYRIVGNLERAGGEKDFLNSPINDVAGFQKQIPGFETAVGFHLFDGSVRVANGTNPDKKFSGRIESQDSWSAAAILTGPEYFDIFKYQWLAGNPKTALTVPFKVVLSEKRARLFFGDEPAQQLLGKKLIYEDSLQVEVSGIVKDWDGNTNFGFTDFISIGTATHSFLRKDIPTEDWQSLSPHRSMAFVKLLAGETADQINKRFAAYIKEHITFHDPGSKLTMFLQPLTEIHFTSDFHRGDDGDSFRKAYMPALYILMGLALFILLIAAANFINLSTAQSVQRAKEIGVRKVLGSSKMKIVFQFLTETFLLTGFAVILSVLLVKPILALFADYIPSSVVFHPFQPSTLAFLLTVTCCTSLLAGLYPARVLASYLPVLALRGSANVKGSDKINLRKALIVFQFTMSLVFIIGVLVIGKQIRFMTNADKGFNTDAIITIYNWSDHDGKLQVFAEYCKKIQGIDKVILQGTSPMGFAQNMDNFKLKGKDESIRQVLANIGNMDFVPFYKMKIVAGRNMFPSDSLREFVINEAFSRSLGFANPRDAIGQILYQIGYQSEKPYPICGVVADYHTGSFHEAIAPVVIENVPGRKNSVAIKLAGNEKNASQVKACLSNIEAEWKKVFPEMPFQYNLLNESISWLYEPEKRIIWLVNIAMGITIFISCMGLFGLGMFTAQRKTKEIGIRKVLGATVIQVVSMLAKEFVSLVFVSIVIATPIAWWLMQRWLQDFAYRTKMAWWIFALAGAISIVIAVMTVSYQAIKAAITNPVKSLRNE